MVRVRRGRPRTSRLRVPLFALLGLLTLTSLLPAHVAGRCFGFSGEATSTEASAWSLTILVSSANGFLRTATFGIHPNATDGYDEAFDAWEPLFNFEPNVEENELTMFAFFYYPENAEPGRNEFPVTVGLRRSIIPPSSEMVFPLDIFYLVNEDTNITLEWDPAVAGALAGYDVEMHTPSGEFFSMTDASSYTFHASPDRYSFSIDIHGEAEDAGQDVPLIIGVASAYAIVIAIIFGLRQARIRRRQG